MTDTERHQLRELARRAATAGSRDLPDLDRRLRRVERRLGRGQPVDRELGRIARRLEASLERVSRRRQAVPQLGYPPGLPVAEARGAIVPALRRNQVVVICGETGSGKTTQLPKMLLEAGFGARGRIGHTQPRRLAARTVAARIADELDTPVGRCAGYKVRFGERLEPDAPIKLMTDGILLAETQTDPLLTEYDALIVDEAHERSLNIDFLLGYLKRLLPRRPDLRVVITSATIDPQGFSRHFDDAPVLEVPGRGWPVEIRYRSPEGAEAHRPDLQDAILEGIDELWREGPGDVLVFLPGERDIRETADMLARRGPVGAEVLPLYARLGARAQNRVFRPDGTGHRIVLATNVAETSVTVPGIRYVIDPGLARINRYSHRTKVQRLPIEAVSRASADQRAGRCGRVGPGICLRLYSEADYQARPRFTDPEILRTSLADVILRMKALGLGEMSEFPFIDPPDERRVKDGLRQLTELGALGSNGELTALGRDLARLPVEPAVGRMILAASREACLTEVLVIAAALSLRDPRERPADSAGAADARHARFGHERSDFLGYLRLWRIYRAETADLSQSALRRYCQENFLSRSRMREWQDIHRELWQYARELGLHPNRGEAGYAAIHRALLTGLLGQIGKRQQEGDYAAPRNVRFRIHPGSALARSGARWVMAAELVETSRLFGTCVAAIEPAWIEGFGGHLLRRQTREPHWERRRGRVRAWQQISLYGLVLVARRGVDYAPLDAEGARRIFIREALVGCDLDPVPAVLERNRRRIAHVEDLEARLRRRDLLVAPDALADFYDRRLPADVCDQGSFRRWLDGAARDEPGILDLAQDTLLRRGPDADIKLQYPDRIEVAGVQVPLSYTFDPAADADGVSAEIPLAALAQLPAEPFEWLVPGLLPEKITALLRSLPKSLRRNVVPAPQFARACARSLPPRSRRPLREAVAGELSRMTGVDIAPADFRQNSLPSHLVMRFRVVDGEGNLQGEGTDLDRLRERLGEQASEAFGSGIAREAREQDEVSVQDFPEVPEYIDAEVGGTPVRAWPALVPEQDRVALRLLHEPARATRLHRLGVAALIRRALAQQYRYLEKELAARREMCLHYAPLGSAEELCRDILEAATAEVFLEPAPLPRDAAQFRACLDRGRGELVSVAQHIADQAAAALATHHSLQKRLQGSIPLACMAAVRDVASQVGRLVYPGFVTATPPRWRPRLPVFLEAAERRLEKLPRRLERDAGAMKSVARWEQSWASVAAVGEPRAAELRWLLEEYRVSLFAQEMGTSVAVSDKRLEALLREIRRSNGE